MRNNDDNNDATDTAEAVTKELYDFCSSDSLSEEGLREIIERHGLTPKNYYVDNYKFFCAACLNRRVTEEIIRCLIEYFPAAASATDGDGWSPLHYACGNNSVTRGIIQLLIDAAPASVRSVDDYGYMPLHHLCANYRIDETTLVAIAELLVEKYPDAVRHAGDDGYLPIHVASAKKFPEFCQVLIEAYPGSERIADADGKLPLHYACWQNTVDTVDYFYKLYPDAINHAPSHGYYPIHYAMSRTSNRNLLTGTVGIVQYLLDCDSNVKLQKVGGKSLLHVACRVTSRQNYNDSMIINAAIEIIKTLYDAHPEAIEGESIVRDMQLYHQQVQAFINSELVYARQAIGHRLMITPDGNGQLPLHIALQNNTRLGSIKLLVKGNPSAIRNFDDSGAIPLHIACEHHESASVVKYLVSLADITLDAIDRQGNTALHYACRGAKYDTIALLLDKFDAVSVSIRNVDEKLPIDLLWESNADMESVAYTESVYRLLRAYPEMTMGLIYRCNLLRVTSESDQKEENVG